MSAPHILPDMNSSSKKGLMALAAMLMATEQADYRIYKERRPRQPLPLPAGVQEYSYPCGFTCRARNQANADRKHQNNCHENH